MYKFSMLSRDTVSFQAKSKNLVKDLYQITSDTKCFSSFIKEAIQNPRKSQETTKILLNQAGSTNNFLKWYFAKGGYKEKYVDYITQTVKEAKNPEELLKISPNWGFWVFEKQFGKDFFIGLQFKSRGPKGYVHRQHILGLADGHDENIVHGIQGEQADDCHRDHDQHIHQPRSIWNAVFLARQYLSHNFFSFPSAADHHSE